jgi:hypothetical protein
MIPMAGSAVWSHHNREAVVEHHPYDASGPQHVEVPLRVRTDVGRSTSW